MARVRRTPGQRETDESERGMAEANRDVSGDRKANGCDEGKNGKVRSVCDGRACTWQRWWKNVAAREKFTSGKQPR